MATFYSIFIRMLFNIRFDFCFEVENQTPNHHFLLRLLCDLDIRALIFASTTNLEAGPRFAGICYIPRCTYHLIYYYLL